MKKGYQQLNKALRKVIQDDPADRLEIELGDEKDVSKFQPQMKLKRWDNEVNCSVRLKDFKDYTISTDKEKIKLLGDKREIHFYTKPEAYEVEVILKEKPATNKVEFSIETKVLDFFYQPELTQAEKDEGSKRPENVVGSYAVYHNGNPINYEGKTEYKAGKAFHIYRPKITDAEGAEVWGELSINKESKILSVTIPKEFLDKAVYPVIVDPTFGYGTIGGSTMGFSTDRVQGSNFTSSEAGTVTSITFYLPQGTYDDGPRKLGIYTDGEEDVADDYFVEGTAEYSGETPDNWVTHDLESPAEITAQDYILVHWGEEITLKYDSGTDRARYADINYPGTWPDPVNNYGRGFDYGNSIYSIYCTYTAGGAADTFLIPEFQAIVIS